MIISWAQTADLPLLAPGDSPLGVQIVANNRNGLDVDKYDYLQRDSMYSGTKISVDVKRIFPFVKVRLPGCGSCMLRLLAAAAPALPRLLHAAAPRCCGSCLAAAPRCCGSCLAAAPACCAAAQRASALSPWQLRLVQWRESHDAASEGVAQACSLSARHWHLHCHAHRWLLQASETDHGGGG